MSNLSSMKRSLTELPADEAFQLIMAVRANRRIQKKNFFKKTTSKPKRSSFEKLKTKLLGMNADERLALLKKLQEEGGLT